MADPVKEHPDWLERLLGENSLVEAEGVEATGLVVGVSEGAVIVSCDSAAWSDGDSREATVSVFAADALYRLTGWATTKGMQVLCDPDMAMERIQRRRWPRKRMDLPVTLCPTEDSAHFEGVPGRSVDISVGGICVETVRALEGEGDPMVIVNLPDGSSILCGTSTVEVEELEDGWRYRLAFRDLGPEDTGRLAQLTGA